MRFYNETHKYTCGIDLHAKNMHICVFDNAGKKMAHRRLKNDRQELLAVLKPYREDLVVSVESTFNWYWLGDLLAQEKIPFVLGHAQYMNAIHHGKSKNDRVDSEKISRLTSGRLLPEAYAYIGEMRTVRDLLRRRLYFVRKRAALKGHVKIVASQYNIPLNTEDSPRGKTREVLLSQFLNEDLRESVDCDLRGVCFLDSLIRRFEKYVLKRVEMQNNEPFELLKTIPGIGDVLALTILYEMHTLERFPRCQDFLSYARLDRSKHTSDGKEVGKGGRKIGNPYLKWAFSEAAVHIVNARPEVKQRQEALKERYGAAGAWSRLSQKIARTVYYMLKNKKAFCLSEFLKNSKEALKSNLNSLEPTTKEAAMVID